MEATGAVHKIAYTPRPLQIDRKMSSTRNTARKRTAPVASIAKDEEEIEDIDHSLHGDGSQMDEEYIMKRQRNNAAVNKTRQKKRAEEQETSKRVYELREENTRLERKLESMKRELDLLKEMVVACAAGKKPARGK